MAKFLPLPSKDHIRLIELLPKSSDGLLSISMRTATLKDAVPDTTADAPRLSYGAVSYVWGVDRASHEISLNGWSYFVRSNLYAFLTQWQDGLGERLVQSTGVTSLWIDAICIDQENVEERNTQVQRMAEIYRRATTVLVWLGECFPHSSYIMGAIGLGTLFSKCDDVDVVVEMVKTGLENLIMLDYWFRTWIVQEFVLAHTIHLICGCDVVSLTELETFVRQLKARRLTLPMRAGDDLWDAFSRSRLNELLLQRVRHPLDRQKTLLELMTINRESKSSEPRDKVFAMLGLARLEPSQKTIEVDYRTDINNIILDVIKSCKVLPKDVVRYTRFLHRLLKPIPAAGRHQNRSDLQGWSDQRMIDSAISPVVTSLNPGRRNTKNGSAIQAVGVVTGRLTQISLIDVIHYQSASVQLGDNLAKHIRHTSVEQSHQNTPISFVNRQKLDDALRRLSSLTLMFMSDTALPPDSSSRSQKPIHRQLCKIYFNGQVRSPIRFGVALSQGNHLKLGDSVVQFFGHDVAMIIEPNLPHSIKGYLIAIEPPEAGSSHPVIDPITFEKLSFESICLPGDLITDRSKLSAGIAKHIMFPFSVQRLLCLASAL